MHVHLKEFNPSANQHGLTDWDVRKFHIGIYGWKFHIMKEFLKIYIILMKSLTSWILSIIVSPNPEKVTSFIDWAQLSGLFPENGESNFWNVALNKNWTIEKVQKGHHFKEFYVQTCKCLNCFKSEIWTYSLDIL